MGLHLGLESLSSDRATTVILITDGAANTGVLDPRAFRALMARGQVPVLRLSFADTSVVEQTAQ